MLKIGVISDTHIYRVDELPQRLLRTLAQMDMVLHAGDLVGLAVLEGLQKMTSQLKAVWGNMDPPEVRAALPQSRIIPAGQFRIGLTHGRGAPANLIRTVSGTFKDERIDCIVYGHAHSPSVKTEQGILYFNPGSPTDKCFAPYNSYGIIEIDSKLTGKIIRL